MNEIYIVSLKDFSRFPIGDFAVAAYETEGQAKEIILKINEFFFFNDRFYADHVGFDKQKNIWNWFKDHYHLPEHLKPIALLMDKVGFGYNNYAKPIIPIPYYYKLSFEGKSK